MNANNDAKPKDQKLHDYIFQMNYLKAVICYLGGISPCHCAARLSVEQNVSGSNPVSCEKDFSQEL